MNRLDASFVVEVATVLVIRSRLWKGRLGNEYLRLGIEMVVEVVAKNEVDENGLGELIMVETGSSEERKKSGADVLKTSNAFVGKTEVEIGLGSENIQRSNKRGKR